MHHMLVSTPLDLQQSNTFATPMQNKHDFLAKTAMISLKIIPEIIPNYLPIAYLPTEKTTRQKAKICFVTQTKHLPKPIKEFWQML